MQTFLGIDQSKPLAVVVEESSPLKERLKQKLYHHLVPLETEDGDMVFEDSLNPITIGE